MYVIRNNPAKSTNPLFWTGFDVVGILRGNEAMQFKTEMEAWGYLSGTNLPACRLYEWTVAPAHSTKLPSYNYGWMVRHPSYDSVH